MKKLPLGGSFIRSMAAGLAVFACVSVAKAIPFASGITNIGTGGANVIQFIMNEAGANVNVVFGDGTTNAMGTLPAGRTNFTVPGTNTTYQIFATKLGTGSPVQITTDTNPAGFNIVPGPRGIDCNKNPTNGYLFGRIYIANDFASSNGIGHFADKGMGLYAISADCSDSYLGRGTNASNPGNVLTGGTVTGNYNSPQNLSINPNDNTIDIADNSTASANIYKFDPDLNTATTVLAGVGQSAGLTAGTHVSPESVFTTGSIATGDLVVYTADADLPAPSSGTALGVGGNGQTQPGNFNMLCKYNIGAGPLPWTHKPDDGVSLCLPTFGGPTFALRLACSLGQDTNKVYGMAYRLNFSDGMIQVFDRNAQNLLYTSLTPAGTDIFNQGGTNGPYFQIRVSPDGKFLAAIRTYSDITVVSLTNGIPDESSFFVISNPPFINNARGGIAFDAADNIYMMSSAQGTMRGFSLGISATTVYSNDITGMNGSFSIQLPPATVSVATTTPLASQNYVNNAINPGVPTPGVFTVNLNTNTLAGPVTVSYSLSGTANIGVNYNINTGTDANGVVITTNSVTFPAGTYPSGNWQTQVKVTPTATPVSGPSTTVGIKLNGGPTYQTAAPLTGTISIANTGPQLVFLSAVAKGNSMNRGIPGDYAEFTVTRWGDTNGPGNNSLSISQTPYTITNFDKLGTAVFPGDYTAPPQNFGTGVPNNSAPGIVIHAGDVADTCFVGNPVRHSNLAQAPVNVTVILALTNNASGSAQTNCTSSENLAYQVTTASVTLTEVDNTVGPEVVVWTDALTNNLDNSWTLTYAATNLGSSPVLPVVIQNYTNDQTAVANGGTNDFRAEFGNPVANDSVPQSPIMAANGWTTALRVTANKDSSGTVAAVNLYPQGQNFLGNVALRFSMYLSLEDLARGNTLQGTAAREMALFGIDHYGTNANWIPTLAISSGSGSGPTNWDGVWFAVDAGTGSLTPADYDGFSSPSLPNSLATGDKDLVSNTTGAENGIFKNPPFTADSAAAGGSPANQWVDVDVEKVQTTSNNVFNITEFIDRSAVLASFLTTNVQSLANYTNGTIMLGYEDPIADQSDNTAFVYYSNVRVVELAPFISQQPGPNLIVLKGSNVTISASSTYSQVAGITNIWFKGNTAAAGSALQTDTSAGTNFTDQLVVNNIQTGTNYFARFSDAAGTENSAGAIIEVVNNPANINAGVGLNGTFTVSATGQSAPTGFQWLTNGVALVNGPKYTNVTTASLTVSNCTVGVDDAVSYSCRVTNAFGVVTTLGATMLIQTIPGGATVDPAATNAAWGSSVTFTVNTGSGTPPFTYLWKKNGANISGATKSTLTLAGITNGSAASYTAGVTNAGGGTVSSAGVLTVTTPPPTLSSAVNISGGHVALSFTSSNSFDASNDFVLQSSPTANGTYTNTPGTFTGSGGSFQVTAPATSSATMFYRLLHVP